MSWKRRSTSANVAVDVDVDVDLVEFDTGQLLQELISRKAISENEAESILLRSRERGRDDSLSFSGAPDELSIAVSELRCGRKTEALIHLERILGGEWIGRLA